MNSGAIYTQAPDKYSGLKAFLENLIGGAIKQEQEAKTAREIMDIARSVESGQMPQTKNPMAAQAFLQHILQKSNP